MKIKNIDDLQNYILESLEKLDSNIIDVTEMGIITKSGEVVVSSLKLKLAYNNMRNERPNVKFLQDCNEGIPIEISSNLKQIK